MLTDAVKDPWFNVNSLSLVFAYPNDNWWWNLRFSHCFVTGSALSLKKPVCDAGPLL